MRMANAKFKNAKMQRGVWHLNLKWKKFKFWFKHFLQSRTLTKSLRFVIGSHEKSICLTCCFTDPKFLNGFFWLSFRLNLDWNIYCYSIECFCCASVQLEWRSTLPMWVIFGLSITNYLIGTCFKRNWIGCARLSLTIWMVNICAEQTASHIGFGESMNVLNRATQAPSWSQTKNDYLNEFKF